MNIKWLTIRQLDKQLKEWRMVSNQYARPRKGWVKTLREALCMSAQQLANRLGLSRARVMQLENAEIHDAITVRTLREVAHALECDFVYAIIPKKNLTLENMIEERANIITQERVSRVSHTMSLEAQTVEDKVLKKHQKEMAKNLMEHLNKKFWEIPKKNSRKNKARKKKDDAI